MAAEDAARKRKLAAAKLLRKLMEKLDLDGSIAHCAANCGESAFERAESRA
jgi:hypothetical protein